MKNTALLAIFLSLVSVDALAQSASLEKRVTFHYSNERLEDALSDISQRYLVYFSYSPDFISVDQRVSAQVDNELLFGALDQLFVETQIVFAEIGNQIVLKIDKNKTSGRLSELGEKNRKRKKKSVRKTKKSEKAKPPLTERENTEGLPGSEVQEPDLVEAPTIGKVEPSRNRPRIDKTLFELNEFLREWDRMTTPKDGRRAVQVSVIPGLGTNARNNDLVTNNVSVNLFWGINGGVDGMEVGGFINSIRKDVKGFQFAGLGNVVAKNVTGTQIAGLFNYIGGTVTGVQVAGLANIVSRDVTGVQASALFNVTGGKSDAFQAAGLFNFNGGDAKMQIGGLFNVAKDVKAGQVGGFLNIAKKVKGFQIGFINMADTVSGVSIGFLNIIKHGYNKFDIYGSEALYANASLKLGAKSFYNIFHFGARFSDGEKYAWGFGYGIGFVSIFNERNAMNFELMATHVSENETFTKQLNLLTQIRFLYDREIAQSIDFFIGPTLNLMFSKLNNRETQEVGSSIVPYTLIDKTFNGKTNLQAWIGVSAGFRF